MNLVTELAGRPARWSDQLRAIAVTAEKDAMAVIEDAIKQLDVPSAAPKNIELTVNLIVGTDSESSIGNPVPKEMESVVAQLKGAFPFKNYRQVDLIEMRTRTGEKVGTVSNGGTVNVTPGSGAVQTNAHIQAVGLAQDGSTVRLDNVALTIHWPGVETGLALQASVDVKEGQKAVLGRIGVAHDQALFVVLTAHVVQ
jgi:phosphotransferase system IIB component